MNYLIPVITLIIAIGIFIRLRQISKETKKIMSTQADFNEKVDAINAGIETIRDAVASEAEQIRNAIAGESIDTSALDGVAGRLQELAVSINDLVVEPQDVPDAEPTGEADIPSGEDVE